MSSEQPAFSVFISWSGKASQIMAGSVKSLLEIFMPWAELFLSTEIQAGKQWRSEINESLKSCNFGIVCLTPENVNSPWIHFEAGALSKMTEQLFVLWLGENAADIPEPLGAFQICTGTKEGVEKLLKGLSSVSSEIGQAEVKNASKSIDYAWADFDRKFIEARESVGFNKSNSRSIDEKLDEILLNVRKLNFNSNTTDRTGKYSFLESIDLKMFESVMRQYFKNLSPEDIERQRSLARYASQLDHLFKGVDISQSVKLGEPPSERQLEKNTSSKKAK